MTVNYILTALIVVGLIIGFYFGLKWITDHHFRQHGLKNGNDDENKPA